MSNKAGVSS